MGVFCLARCNVTMITVFIQLPFLVRTSVPGSSGNATFVPFEQFPRFVTQQSDERESSYKYFDKKLSRWEILRAVNLEIKFS